MRKKHERVIEGIVSQNKTEKVFSEHSNAAITNRSVHASVAHETVTALTKFVLGETVGELLSRGT